MRLGIVTNYKWIKQWDNYGTIFQYYALQSALKNLGHDPFLIRTTGLNEHTLLQRLYNAFIRCILEPYTASRILTGMPQGNSMIPPDDPRILKFNKSHPRNFDQFIRDHLVVSPEEYDGVALKETPPDADGYVVGSDNVWAKVTLSDFLGFGGPDALRVAYAVSTHWEELSASWYYRARSAIRNINHISVREENGIAVCGKLGRSDAICTLDPTLLVESHVFKDLIPDEMTDAFGGKRTLLVYWLNASDSSDIPIKEFEMLAKSNEWQLKIIPLQGTELFVPKKYVYTPNPIDWLRAISSAEMVLTNSFHGTAFSIIFKTPFISMPKICTNRNSVNSRFSSLLGKLGLGDRIPTTVSPNHLQHLVDTRIDWDSVSTNLEVERLKSITFLARSLTPST